VILTYSYPQFNIKQALCYNVSAMSNLAASGLYDVLIVGAGPVGSYIAYRLAGSGHSVLVFEEHQRIGEPMQCTGIVGAECLKRFPLFDGTVLRKVNSARLFSPSGTEIRLWRDEAQAYVIDRIAFDRSIAEKAQTQGAKYFTGCRVKRIEVVDGRVKAETEGGVTYEAKAAAIASGFYSRIPQRLGLGRVRDFVVGAQAEVTANNLSEIEVYFNQEIAPGFFAWLVPTTPKRALVGLFCRSNPVGHLRNLLSSLFEAGKIDSPNVRITPGGIPLKPPRKTYRERVLVVGDAAGQVKPTTGGGVYYGLLCADIAADTLIHALDADNFSERLFAEYQKAWRHLIGAELRTGYIARRIYEKRSNRQIDHLFNTIESKGIHQSLLKSHDVSFDWHRKAIIKSLQYVGPWRPIFARGGKA